MQPDWKSPPCDPYVTPPVPKCGAFVSWWNGEYEGYCQLPEGHEGDHQDDLGAWFNDDGEDTGCDHE